MQSSWRVFTAPLPLLFATRHNKGGSLTHIHTHLTHPPPPFLPPPPPSPYPLLRRLSLEAVLQDYFALHAPVHPVHSLQLSCQVTAVHNKANKRVSAARKTLRCSWLIAQQQKKKTPTKQTETSSFPSGDSHIPLLLPSLPPLPHVPCKTLKLRACRTFHCSFVAPSGPVVPRPVHTFSICSYHIVRLVRPSPHTHPLPPGRRS